MLKQIWKQKQRLQLYQESGYTIIEGLVAMVIVSIVMASVAPILALSVATRVQARRVELAAQAARSYIDGVRSGVIAAPDWLGIEPSNKNTSAPTGGSLTCDDGEYCGDVGGQNGQLFCVDGGDGGGCQTKSTTDMVIQAGRYHPRSIEATFGYELLVRVYRADAFNETSLCPKGTGCPDDDTQQSVVTSGIGNRRLPMLQITTEIAPKENSLKRYRDLLE